MNPQMKNLPPPRFTRQQIAWLEKQYPEYCATPNSTEAAMRFHAGQRSVIWALRELEAPEQGNPNG